MKMKKNDMEKIMFPEEIKGVGDPKDRPPKSFGKIKGLDKKDLEVKF